MNYKEGKTGVVLFIIVVLLVLAYIVFQKTQKQTVIENEVQNSETNTSTTLNQTQYSQTQTTQEPEITVSQEGDLGLIEKEANDISVDIDDLLFEDLGFE